MTQAHAIARQTLALMDLTSLGDEDSEGDIRRLCARAATPFGHPAAVCVYPRFVGIALQTLETAGLAGKVKVATVANFPAGDADVAQAAHEVEQAVKSGADEVDVVFPWRAFLAGDEAAGRALIAACREAAGTHGLKVILETGELSSADRIRRAAELAIAGGADFVKTSTGKVAVNATPEAARVLLETIRASGRSVGCKVSGGIGTFGDAAGYLEIARELMGVDWISPQHFRIGASGLLDRLLDVLDDSGSEH